MSNSVLYLLKNLKNGASGDWGSKIVIFLHDTWQCAILHLFGPGIKINVVLSVNVADVGGEVQFVVNFPSVSSFKGKTLHKLVL